MTLSKAMLRRPGGQAVAAAREAEAAKFLDGSRPWIYRLALAIVSRPDLAEDVAQEALLRGFARLDTLAGTENPRAWMRRVVVNQSLTALRRAPISPLIESQPGKDNSEDALVRIALSRLRPEHRALLGLAYFEDLSYREMGDALGIPEGTVASRLHAAKAEFRKVWGNE